MAVIAVALAGAAALALILATQAPRTGPPPSSNPSELSRPTGSSASPSASVARPSGSANETQPSPSSSTISHVYLIVLENHSYGDIVGDDDAPYLASLEERFGLATQYRAVAHPSQPNYLALFSGSTQGVEDDDVHDLDTRNLADLLEPAGRTWRVYAENVPGDCFRGADASDGPDGPGTYARKHEPAISFADISGDPARCANITDLSAFDPDKADFELIIPNLCHDMHDCAIGMGDDWLSSFVPQITDSASWRDGGTLFITFDESDDSSDPRVATYVVSPRTPAGFRSDTPHNHESIIRTIEVNWGLGCLAAECDASPMMEFFGG
jgi:phosphatidylinositol-3-phosphatase